MVVWSCGFVGVYGFVDVDGIRVREGFVASVAQIWAELTFIISV